MIYTLLKYTVLLLVSFFIYLLYIVVISPYLKRQRYRKYKNVDMRP